LTSPASGTGDAINASRKDERMKRKTQTVEELTALLDTLSRACFWVREAAHEAKKARGNDAVVRVHLGEADAKIKDAVRMLSTAAVWQVTR
jgi:hypothetical protein